MARGHGMSWKIGTSAFDAAARATGNGRYSVTSGGQVVEVEARVDRDGVLIITMPDGRVVRSGVSRVGDDRWLSVGRATLRATKVTAKARSNDAHAGMEAPMPGRVVRVAVAVGDSVKKGQTVVTLEAMKMEHALKAPRDGVVREVGCREGELVQAGVALVVLE